MKKIFLFLFLLIISVNVFSFEIAKNTNVVLGKDATTAEKFACNEFVKYIKEITDIDLNISEKEIKNTNNIFIGQTKSTNSKLQKFNWNTLKDDGILIKSGKNYLVLAGDRPRGTIYAVYTFLEDYCGVRYILPNEEFVPKKNTLEIEDINVVYTPPFFMREVFGVENNTNPLFSVKQKLNGLFPQIPEEMGGHITIGKGTGDFVHTFRIYMDPKKYGESHPEWFALNGGVRVPNVKSQICLTNKEMLDELAKNLIEYIKENDCPMYSVSQNDNMSPCECDNCKAFAEKHGQSGLLINAVNYIADIVKKKYPDKLIETLAYQYTRHFPTGGIIPHDNVIVRLCSVECDFSKPFTHSANKTFYKDLEDWSSLKTPLSIWDYNLNYKNFILINPNIHVQQENIKIFREHNVKSIFAQGNHANYIGPMLNIKRYIIGKLLWDPDIDVQKEMEIFAKLFYGPAYEDVLSYIYYVENVCEKSNIRVLIDSLGTTYMETQDYINCFEILEKALDKTDKNSKYYNRILCEKICLEGSLWNDLKIKINEVSKSVPIHKNYREYFDYAKDFGEKNNMTYFAEGVPFGRVKFDDIPEITIKGKRSPLTENLDEKDYLDLQCHELIRGNQFNDTFAHYTDDPEASSGKAFWMNPEHLTWYVQRYITFMSQMTNAESADVYLTYRVDPDESNKHALTVGIYNIDKSQDLLTYHIKAYDTPDNKYKTVKIGTMDLLNNTSQNYIYFCGSGNKDATKGVYIDRILFIFNN